MSRLLYSMMTSLDGFVATPDGGLDWVLIDEELHTYCNELARAHRAFLYGRRLYELMAGFWPTADEDPAAPPYVADFARIWRPKPKVVFSSTLDRVDWNSRLERGDVVSEVARLKAEPGADLEVGGPTLAAPLVRAGLVDAYELMVQPVLLGAGVPFWPSDAPRQPLQLVEQRRFASGVVSLRYQAA